MIKTSFRGDQHREEYLCQMEDELLQEETVLFTYASASSSSSKQPGSQGAIGDRCSNQSIAFDKSTSKLGISNGIRRITSGIHLQKVRLR